MLQKSLPKFLTPVYRREHDIEAVILSSSSQMLMLMLMASTVCSHHVLLFLPPSHSFSIHILTLYMMYLLYAFVCQCQHISTFHWKHYFFIHDHLCCDLRSLSTYTIFMHCRLVINNKICVNDDVIVNVTTIDEVDWILKMKWGSGLHESTHKYIHSIDDK